MGNPEDKLEKLREAFARQLPERVATIVAAWEGLPGEGWCPERLGDLVRLLHNLAGTAATFGLADVAGAARKAEKEARRIVESCLPPTQEQCAEIRTLLSALPAAGTSRRAPALAPEERDGILTKPHCAEQRKRVYLADDDPVLSKSLASQIGCFGYDVRTFTRLSELEGAVLTAPPAAIIMATTFQKAEMAGAEAVAAIRDEGGAPVPVIFISRRTDLDCRLKAVKAGGYAYFVKPVPISDLVDKLDALTSDRRADPYRILIVDDDPELAAFHAHLLERHGMVTETVTDPFGIMRPLVEFNPDLILMDMYMPDCTGNELARVIRQMEAYVSIPIVFLSAETRIDKQLVAMSMGGDDFLTKPIEPGHLISSVTSRAERMRILRTFMERDSLTGLLNHTKTKEELDLAALRARREGKSLAFAMIDIDHFKAVNDTHGHPVGDQVIVILARLLQQRLRRTDIIGRYGGEEFAVILPDTDLADSLGIMDEIRQVFERIRHQGNDGDFSVTFSCGVAGLASCRSGAELNSAADRALYEAKRSGRNRVAAFRG